MEMRRIGRGAVTELERILLQSLVLARAAAAVGMKRMTAEEPAGVCRREGDRDM